MLITLMLFFTLSQPSASNALETKAQFRTACADAWMQSKNGNDRAELGFVVWMNGKTGEILRQAKEVKGNAQMNIPVAHGIFAIVHTHPNNLNDRPSPADIESAKTWGHPIYVISQSGLWEAEPNGSVVKVYSGTEWMR